MGAGLTRLGGVGWVNEFCSPHIDELIGIVSRDSSQVPFGLYRLCLHYAKFVFQRPEFFQLDPNFICKFVEDLGALTFSEAEEITHKLVRCSTQNKRTAVSFLSTLFTGMRVRVSDASFVSVSPSVDEDMYRRIVGEGFATMWQSERWKPELFDFSEQQRKEERDRQLADDGWKSFDVPHDVIAALAATENRDFFKKLKKDYREVQLCAWTRWRPKVWVLPPANRREWPEDSRWCISNIIHNGLYDLLCYVLSLLPELMSVCAFGSGQVDTIATFILEKKLPKWQERLFLTNLHKMGCNLNLPNECGHRPIDLAKRGSTMDLLKSFGCSVSERNENGDSSLEINSRNFDASVLMRLLENGADVLDPNPREGWFWIPWVLHNEFDGGLGFDGFQKMVRERMRGNRRGDYFQNKICMEIVGRSIDKWAATDSKDLLKSVTNNDFERAKVLVALGAPTEARNEEGNTCLLICAETGNVEMAKLLIQNFANRQVLNLNGENCFRVACARGNLEIASYFQSEGVDVDSRALDWSTALHVAYRGGSESALEFCLNKGCSPNVADAENLTVQFLAFRDHKDELAERIQNDYDGNINVADSDNNSLAHLAYQKKDLDRIRYLTQRGLNLELRNKYGRTVFMEAVMEHNQEMCGQLLEIGSNINTYDGTGQSPLMIAYLSDDKSLFDFLIQKECNPNIQEHEAGKTVLMMALEKLDFATCDVLIAHGADINIRDNNGRTPIMRCVLDPKYDRRTFDYLIGKGCSVSVVDYENWHLLSYLIKANKTEEAKIILERRNVTVTCPNCGEGEPIAVALSVSSQYWFDELVKRGADAMNNSYPVTEKYLRQRWFSIDGLRRLRKHNLSVGAPLQYAMECNMRDAVDCLWNSATKQMQEEASQTRDSSDRTPLMQAIRLGFSDLVGDLISRRFKCDGCDSTGATPILYAARAENMWWTSSLYDIVGVKGAKKRDSDGNSALTYADNNGWRDLCERWFMDGIDVDCNRGGYGIVKHYATLLKEHRRGVEKVHSLLSKAENKLSSAERKLHDTERRIDSAEKSIRDRQKTIARGPPSSAKGAQSAIKGFESQLRSLRPEREKAAAMKREAQEVVSIYRRAASQIESASRRDILFNLEGLVREATNEQPLNRLYRL